MGRTRYLFSKNIAIFLIFTLSLINISEKDFKRKKSFHFVVYYNNCSQNFLDRVIREAESAYTEIAEELRFFREDPWVWDNRAKIFILDSKEDYLKATHMPSWSAGCAYPSKKTVYTYTGSYKFFGYTLIHELTHLVFREIIGESRVPLWLEEGVAIYMERRKEAYNLVKAVKSLIRKNEIIPFGEVLSLEFRDLDKERGPSEEFRGISFVEKFYLQAFSLVYFLIKEYDMFRFTILLRKIREGYSFSESFSSTYRLLNNREKFEREWRDFYLRR